MQSKQPTLVGLLIGAIMAAQGCQSSPRPIFSDAKGTHLSQGADIKGEDNAVQAILSTFKQSEEAVRQKNLDALMELYSDNYKHGGYTKESVKAVWRDLFAHYHDFADNHIFSKVKIEGSKTPPQAQITCTGSLWAISNETGERVNIDSWYGEVHYLTYEHGRWHLAGTFWEIPRAKESRGAFLPHPFF
jgi:hypothetical protein